MFYAITLPHGRHEIDDFGIYRDKPWTDQQKAYAAQVTRVDSDMGELVDTLRELGIAENTLIVFSGDNGSSFDPIRRSASCSTRRATVCADSSAACTRARFAKPPSPGGRARSLPAGSTTSRGRFGI